MKVVPGRLTGEAALSLKDGASVRFPLDEPVEDAFVEFWVRPQEWDAYASQAVHLARFEVGQHEVLLTKPADEAELQLIRAEDDVVLQRFPVYTWMVQDWMEDGEKDQDFWRYINISLSDGNLQLSVDGFAAPVGKRETFGALRAVTLEGTPAAVFSSLHVLDGPAPAHAEMRDRYRSLYRGDPLLRSNLVTLPKLEQSPSSKFEADEWARAPRLIGFSALRGEPRSLTHEPITAYAAYDAEAFHLAIRTPYEGRLRARQWGDRDRSLWSEESWEMFLLPPWTGTPDYVQLVGNAYGDQADLLMMNLDWNGQWDWNAQIGDGEWVGVLRAPFSGIEASRPEEGTVWTMNLLNSRAGAGWSYVHGAFHNIRAFGEVRFEEDPPVVRPERPELQHEPRAMRLPVELLAPRAYDAEVEAVLEVYGEGDILPQRVDREVVHLAAGERHRLVLDVPLEGIPAGRFAFFVRQGDEDLYSISALFPWASPRVRQGPIQEDSAQKEASIEQEAQAAEPEAEPTPEERAYARQWSDEELGETLRQSMEWAHERIGDAKGAPAPWTAMRVDGQTVHCWNRTYRYDDSLLPVQITSGGEELLAAPSRLVIVANGQRYISTEADVDLTLVHDGLVRATMTSHAGPFRIIVHAKHEFDGMVKTELRIEAAEGTPRLDEIALEYPLVGERSGLFHYSSSVSGHPPETDSGKVPEQGFRLDLFRETVWLGEHRRGLAWFAEGMKNWPLRDESAIQTLTPGADGSRTFRVKLGDRPHELDEPLEIVFGIQATPVRPRRADHRSRGAWQSIAWNWFWGDGQYYPFHRHEKQIRAAREQVEAARARGREVMPTSSLRFFGRYRFYESRFGKIPDPGLMHRAIMIWGSQWQRTLSFRPEPPRIPLRHTAPGNWYESGRFGGPRGLISLCPNSDFRNYYLWELRRLIDETGLGAIYLDQPMSRCDNPRHGCGYIDYAGQWRASTPLFAARDMVKRIYQLFHEAHGEALIKWHSSNHLMLPAISFIDVFWDGENYNTGPLKVFEFYSRTLDDPYRLQVQHTGLPFGFTASLLPQLHHAGGEASSPASVRDMFGLFFVHDSLVTPIHTPKDALAAFLEEEWLALDLASMEPIYYWEEDPGVAVTPEPVHFILFHGDNEAALVLFNWSDRPVDAEIHLNGARLGLDTSAMHVTDALHMDMTPLPADQFSISVAPRDFRMLRLQ